MNEPKDEAFLKLANALGCSMESLMKEKWAGPHARLKVNVIFSHGCAYFRNLLW